MMRERPTRLAHETPQDERDPARGRLLAARSSPDMINSSPQFKAWIERARAKQLEPEVRRAGLTVEKDGHQLAGPRCPTCPDSGDDRFWVDIRKNTWGCRHCGKRAEDVIALVMAVSGLKFLDACERLTGERPPEDRDNLNHEEPRQGRSEPRQAAPGQQPAQSSHDDDEARRRRALAIWHEAKDPRGTLAQTYRESRVNPIC